MRILAFETGHVLNRKAWIWKYWSDAIWCSAAGRIEIGDVHVRKSVWKGAFGFRALDVNGCTVHVHFAVSDSVEPCPRERVVTGWNVLRDLVLERG